MCVCLCAVPVADCPCPHSGCPALPTLEAALPCLPWMLQAAVPANTPLAWKLACSPPTPLPLLPPPSCCHQCAVNTTHCAANCCACQHLACLEPCHPPSPQPLPPSGCCQCAVNTTHTTHSGCTALPTLKAALHCCKPPRSSNNLRCRLLYLPTFHLPGSFLAPRPLTPPPPLPSPFPPLPLPSCCHQSTSHTLCRCTCQHFPCLELCHPLAPSTLNPPSCCHQCTLNTTHCAAGHHG